MRLLIVGAILLSLCILLLFVVKVQSLLKSRRAEVSVASHRDAATDRAEAVATFGSYDAIAERQQQRSPAEQQEREAIAQLFSNLEECATDQDNAGFVRLVDFDRFLKRMELTGNLEGWTSLEKRYVRTELKESASVEPYWRNIIMAGIVPSSDDLDTRIVYTFSWGETDDSQTEHRFWIGRDGDSWMIYDWERLDLGITHAEEWGIYCKYFDSPLMDGFRKWGKLIAEVDELTAKGEREAAMEKLRVAEGLPVPPELSNYRVVLTGYRWFALGEYGELEKSYRKLKQPDDAPGLYYSLMNQYRWSQPDEGLKYAERYEATVGDSPALAEAKARLFARLNRKEEAAQEWKRVLQLQPDNSRALAELFLALPKDDKSQFAAYLAGVEDPNTAAKDIAASVGYRDFRGLLYLVEYLEREAPGTPGTLYVNGLASYLDGRYGKAAKAYRRAFESETEQEERDDFVNAYVDAMIADSKVAEALENVPNREAVFESLFYRYDEGEISLTDAEYKQLVDMYAASSPDKPDATERQAALAIEDRRFDEAERLLRRGLAQLPDVEPGAPDGDDDKPAEQDENETYRNVFSDSLASVLAELDRLEEAYAMAGEPGRRFPQLAREAVADHRWQDVRQLMDWRRVDAPEDPQIQFFAGELAAHEKRWDEAIAHYRQALEGISPDEAWQAQQRLMEASVDAGRWREYYTSHDDQTEAFEALARKFVGDKKWDALNDLLAEHGSLSRYDPKVTKYEAEFAWEHGDYAEYAKLADELLRSDDPEAVDVFDRGRMESRRLSALLRSGKLAEALDHAREKQSKDNDAAWLAIVHAAAGHLSEARRFAEEAATAEESAYNLYTQEDVGHVFLSDDFRELQREFPVELPYDVTPTLAVFLLDAPRSLEPADITKALQQLGVDMPAEPVPLRTSDKKGTRALALRFDKASIWLATGDGKFDADWKVVEESKPLAGPINGSRAWLAVGTAGWTKLGRRQVEALARHLSGRLAEGHATVLCTSGTEAWQPFTAYPVTPEMLDPWQTTGNLSSFSDQSATLPSPDRDVELAAERQFDRGLRAAVRESETWPYAKLEVWVSLSDNPAIDLLPIAVSEVRRTYGSLEFEGTLQQDSPLFPQLKAGLPMQFYKYKVQAWRLNDGPLTYRP